MHVHVHVKDRTLNNCASASHHTISFYIISDTNKSNTMIKQEELYKTTIDISVELWRRALLSFLGIRHATYYEHELV